MSSPSRFLLFLLGFIIFSSLFILLHLLFLVPHISKKSVPQVIITSPSGPENLIKGQDLLIQWHIAPLPSDPQNWTIKGNLVSQYVGALESKNGKEIFSFPLSTDPSQYNWQIARSFSEDLFSPDQLNRTLSDVKYQFKICIVRNTGENYLDEMYQLGYWNDPNGKFFCNIPSENNIKIIDSINIGCKTGGCSGEICQDANAEPAVSICLFKEEYDCLKLSRCEKQATGKCGWTKTPEYLSCLDKTK